MRRLRFRDKTEQNVGIVAEGLQLSDGRVLVQSMRVRTSPVLYRTIADATYDWRGAELEWIDPEAEVVT
jgi:hypothetical protein